MGTLDLTERELSAYWMPFTHNRYFKQHHARRVLAKAEGAYYWTTEGEKLFDALSGLWCCGLGHRHPKIVEAVKQQLDIGGLQPRLPDGLPRPPSSSPSASSAWLPAAWAHVFFVNSGSEAVDTALKMALAYHRLKGEASAPASSAARRATTASASAASPWAAWSPTGRCTPRPCCPASTTCPTPTTSRRWPSRKGEPTWGAHLANELERLDRAA